MSCQMSALHFRELLFPKTRTLVRHKLPFKLRIVFVDNKFSHCCYIYCFIITCLVVVERRKNFAVTMVEDIFKSSIPNSFVLHFVCHCAICYTHYSFIFLLKRASSATFFLAKGMIVSCKVMLNSLVL